MYIDESAIQRIRDIGGDELVAKMINLFLTHAPQNYQLALEAKDEQNLKQLAESVHAIKSSSGNFGAQPLFDSSETVERLAREGQTKEAIASMEQLETCFQETIDEMKKFLGEND